MKPLIGISCCTKLFGAFGMPNHAASDTYIRATDFVVGGIPVLIPANGERSDTAGIVARLDGLMLTGSRSNVEPARYGGAPHPEGVPEDHERDAATLPLIRAAIAAGVPVLAICRGLQELNVALGGSLHQRLQDLPNHMDHATPMAGNGRLRTGKAHEVAVTPGGWLHRLAQAPSILVNSLHNQGIDRLADGLIAEATAPDGTIEGVRGSFPGFVVGVQWHPEYDWERDELSRRIFESFGAAVAARAQGIAAAAD